MVQTMNLWYWLLLILLSVLVGAGTSYLMNKLFPMDTSRTQEKIDELAEYIEQNQLNLDRLAAVMECELVELRENMRRRSQ